MSSPSSSPSLSSSRMKLGAHQAMVGIMRAFQLVNQDSETDSDPGSDRQVDPLLDPFINDPPTNQIENHNEQENPSHIPHQNQDRVSPTIDPKKLIQKFNLPNHEELIAQFPCCLFRSVLLNGHIYLTHNYLCFHAHLNSSDDDKNNQSNIFHSGTLSRKHPSTKLKQPYSKYWFILKDSILSWYSSSHDLYFPSGQLDLIYCTSIDHHSPSQKHPYRFKLVLKNKTYTFASESEQRKNEWINKLKRAIFACQHSHDNVKISIPLETIQLVERCHSLQFVETIRVKTKEWVDKQPSPSSDHESASRPNHCNVIAVPDDYFFAFGQDVQVPLDHIQSTLNNFRSKSPPQLSPAVTPGPDLSHSQQEQQNNTDLPPSTSTIIAPISSPRSPIQCSSSSSRLHSNPTSPPKVLKNLGERIRKISSSSNKLVGSPYRNNTIKVHNPDRKSKGSPGQIVQKFNEARDPNNLVDGTSAANTLEQPCKKAESEHSENLTSSHESSAAQTSLSGAIEVAPRASTSQSQENEISSEKTSSSDPDAATAPLEQSHTYPPPLSRRSTSYISNRYTTSPPSPKKHPTLRPPDEGSPSSTWDILPDWLKNVSKPPSTRVITSAAKNISMAAAKTIIGGSGTMAKEQDDNEDGGDSDGERTRRVRRKVSITVSNVAREAHGELHSSLVLVDRTTLDETNPLATTLLSSIAPADERKFFSAFSFGGAASSSSPAGIKGGGASRSQKTMKLMLKVNCYLFRGMPIYGQLYISTPYILKKSNYHQCCVCFKGQKPISKTVTKMILPIVEILELRLKKGFRFGYFGLGMLVKEEEIFVEFGEEGYQAVVLEEMGRILEEIRALERSADGGVVSTWTEKADGREIQDQQQILQQHQQQQTIAEPPIMFQSTTSSFLTFKPTESLHITCLTIGSRGDVQPYIALCIALMEDGHKTRIASHGEYREWIEGYGIQFVEIGGDPAELMKICVDNGMFTLSFLKEGLGKFRGWLDELLISAADACQGTDLLIESPSAMAGLHIAEALGIPYFRAFTMPWTRTRTYPHSFAVPDHKMGGGYNFMTYTVFDQVFWRATASQINRWRKDKLGLQPTSLEKMATHRVPFLYNFSPTIVPMPLDWFEWVHITGYWFLDEAGSSLAVEEEEGSSSDGASGNRGRDGHGKKVIVEEGLVKFLECGRREGKKIVYIGFGSIVVPDPIGLSKMIVEAVTKSGVYAVVSKGWSDRLQAGKAKEPEKTAVQQPRQQQTEFGEEIDEATLDKAKTIYHVKSVPHDWLFPRIDAVCHHGGAGTTGSSLRAGVPTIIRPFFGDQYFWADRVEHLGIGISLRKMNAKNLAKSLETATRDEAMIKKAKMIGEQIRAESGVRKAVECIYRDLEYAKSLIKKKKERPEVIGCSGSGESSGLSSLEEEEEEEGEAEQEREVVGQELLLEEDLENLELEDNSSWDLLSQPPQSPAFGPIG